MIMMYTASRSIMYNASNSAYFADDIICFIMWAMLSTALFFCGIMEYLDKQKWPPALLRAFGSPRYLTSLCAASFMSFALNVRTTSYFVSM